MSNDDSLQNLILIWSNAPAYVQTYLSEQYPEMWYALQEVSKR